MNCAYCSKADAPAHCGGNCGARYCSEECATKHWRIENHFAHCGGSFTRPFYDVDVFGVSIVKCSEYFKSYEHALGTESVSRRALRDAILFRDDLNLGHLFSDLLVPDVPFDIFDDDQDKLFPFQNVPLESPEFRYNVAAAYCKTRFEEIPSWFTKEAFDSVASRRTFSDQVYLLNLIANDSKTTGILLSFLSKERSSPVLYMIFSVTLDKKLVLDFWTRSLLNDIREVNNPKTKGLGPFALSFGAKLASDYFGGRFDFLYMHAMRSTKHVIEVIDETLKKNEDEVGLTLFQDDETNYDFVNLNQLLLAYPIIEEESKRRKRAKIGAQECMWCGNENCNF